jgi:hypothetical protein
MPALVRARIIACTSIEIKCRETPSQAQKKITRNIAFTSHNEHGSENLDFRVLASWGARLAPPCAAKEDVRLTRRRVECLAMNCFYHPDTPALGMCRWCQRGICTTCIAETASGLACLNRHEQLVQDMGKMMRENTKALGIMGSLLFVMGAVFGGYGLMQYVQNDYFDAISSLIGAVFILFGCVLIGKSLHARSKRTTTNV